ncbi:MAG: enoyl-CoA hydratase/isomerase family protein [Chloroflexi bacterium]|nr:enoyl-CoA hydratase/isomerase family protein [Chloroflexota bacterium]
MPVTTSTVIYETRDQVAYITLNRPDVMNALNREITTGIEEALTEYRDNDSLLAAIVTGAGGRAFSAGLDQRERVSDQQTGGERRRRQPLIFTDLGVWKPLIAAIDGYALGGGLELALQCDIRIATERSRLGLPEPRVGLMAGYGLHMLNRMVPLGEALYMQLTGHHQTAQEAHRIGLIHAVLPDREALMKEAEAIAGEIKLCSPLALQGIKKVVMEGRNVPREYSYKLAGPILDWLYTLEDTKEGARAFVEKRPPAWKMR